MDTAVIVLRVALSLGVVLALMWVLHRVSRKKLVGGKAHGRRAASVEVVGRQGIGGKASVVVVDVEGERLVLGVTEHGVSLLTSGAAPAPELTIVTGPVVLPTGRDTTPTPSADVFRRELEQQGGADPRLPADLPMRPRNRRPQRAVVPTAAQLQGSILSADTWRQAAAALKNRRAG
ncbi:flagellar biosynthetic protein FliO [Curtobacterium sp. 458]|uniref:FliO/MopB family protein n=1 Tax=Curtobacterium sp. 458 TaxID=3050069 RepID=UPI0025B5F730|nr:flagellar biosynthetic protein FliO [Curtobacterium sp. 458]WJX99442.1 flagellar biosynthetic protein FliO [Curtobacterium sp. 458]